LTQALRRPASAALAAAAATAFLGLAACGAPDSGAAARPASASASVPGGAPADDGPALPAAVGSTAPSNRVTFVPERVVLPGGDSAPVQPAVTRDGELQVPEDVQHVGWWDGSAHAGDPFGNTVVAGHVDSKTEGLGFFVRLLSLKKGETVTLRGAGGHHLAYTVTSVRTIKKDALATGSAAFDQTGDPHLVLVTCGGDYHRGAGGYDSNVVVTARPKGLAR